MATWENMRWDGDRSVGDWEALDATSAGEEEKMDAY